MPLIQLLIYLKPDAWRLSTVSRQSRQWTNLEVDCKTMVSIKLKTFRYFHYSGKFPFETLKPIQIDARPDTWLPLLAKDSRQRPASLFIKLTAKANIKIGL